MNSDYEEKIRKVGSDDGKNDKRPALDGANDERDHHFVHVV